MGTAGMISFREIRDEDAMQILEWRTSPRISSMMLTDVEFNPEKQLLWIQASRKRPEYYHWIFQKDGNDAGLLAIWVLPGEEKAANIGFYVGKEKYGYIAIPTLQLCYSYIFTVLSRRFVHLQIHSGNKIIKIQEYLGFRRNPDNDIFCLKNGLRQPFLGYSLSAEDFLAKCSSRVSGRFPTAMRTHGDFFHIEGEGAPI